MIVFDLNCGNNHQFESWFANSEAFEKLKAAGEITCPVCGDARVVKALMARGLLTVPAGDNVVRLVPPLIITKENVDEALTILAAAAGDVVGDIAQDVSGKDG